MNQDKNCSTCNFRFFGMGCTKTGKRVTDHEHCEKWEKLNNNNEKLTAEAIEQYRLAGYILDIEKVSA